MNALVRAVRKQRILGELVELWHQAGYEPSPPVYRQLAELAGRLADQPDPEPGPDPPPAALAV